MAKKKSKNPNYDRMVAEIAGLVDSGETHFDAQKFVEKRNGLTPDQIRILEGKYFHQVCLTT